MLQPIRFKNSQELTQFINRLHTMGLIEINNSKEGHVTIEPAQTSLSAQFLKAEDGNIYFLADVQEFLQHASNEEIQATQINLFTVQKKSVTLAQLKADPGLLENLAVSREISTLILMLNPEIYTLPECTSVTGKEEISSKKQTYNNEALHSQIRLILSYKSLMKSVTDFNHLTHSLNGFKVVGHLPFPFQSADFISQPNKDIFRITIIQEKELKNQLLTALEQCEQQEEKDQLNLWIKEIEINTSKIKEVLQIIKTKLEEHQEMTQKSKEQYQEFTKDDPILEQKKNKIAALKAEIKNQETSLEKQRSLFATLKSVTVVGTFILIGLLATMALVITPLIALSLYPVTILTGIIGVGITLLSLSVLLVPPLRARLSQGLLWIKNVIENQFDSRITIKETRLNDLKDEENLLNGQVDFCNAYDKLKEQLVGTVIDHGDLIREIESDLHEINDFEASQKTQTIENEGPVLNNKVSGLSMFHHQKEAADLELPANTQENTLR